MLCTEFKHHFYDDYPANLEPFPPVENAIYSIFKIHILPLLHTQTFYFYTSVMYLLPTKYEFQCLGIYSAKILNEKL